MHFNTSHRNLHLDPAPDGAAGGAAAAGSPAGEQSAPAFDASAYVPRADFEAIQSDYQSFRQTAEQRFQEYDSRLPKPAKAETKEDKEPDAESGEYDFQKPGEFQRYQRDLTRFHLNQNLSEREKTQAQSNQERQHKELIQSAQDAHYARQDAYKALNPDYDEFKKIGFGNEAVALAVLESDFSANIHHFLQKNHDKRIELQKLSHENPRAALRMIGRMESQFEAQVTTPQNKRTAAAAQPTGPGFGGSKPSGSPAKTKEQIFDDFHK